MNNKLIVKLHNILILQWTSENKLGFDNHKFHMEIYKNDIWILEFKFMRQTFNLWDITQAN